MSEWIDDAKLGAYWERGYVVVPGTHRYELLPRRVHLEMEPGDTVFFHPLLLHGSGRNRTRGFRRAISARCAAVDVEWVWTHQNLGVRRYRIVRGPRAGQRWSGAHASQDRMDPKNYVVTGGGAGRRGPGGGGAG